MPGSRPQPVGPRLWPRTVRDDGCWRWQGTTNRDGYGLICVEGKMRSTHRVAWELHHGEPAPDGLDVCHTCDVRNCINPEHLFLGTHQANMQDMVRKGRSGPGQPGGEGHPSAKLSDLQVDAIRTRFAEGAEKWDLAREYGVSWSCINLIVKGRRRASRDHPGRSTGTVPLSRAVGASGEGVRASV